MTIERLYIRPAADAALVARTRVRVVAGQGIEGDRYFGARDEPGQNVTFVEAEAIEAFAARHGRPVDLSVTARNVVTRGIRLDELVGRRFRIGGVRYRGIDRCEPCRRLGEALAGEGLSPAQVVREWLDTGGLRADVLDDGLLAVGAEIVLDAFG